MDADSALAVVQSEKAKGKTPGDIVPYLRDHGLTIVESIKVISRAFGMPLSDAKDVVANNPAWLEVVKASEPLHEELLDVLARTSPAATKKP